jgi:hypothetical protein
MKQMLAIGLLVLPSAGCGLLGPSCLERREEGTLPPITGSVDAGEIAMHRLSYDTRGSQNDARLSWPGQGSDGAQLRAYATRVACETFRLPAETNTGDCAILAAAGWSPAGTSTTAIVTHGRGNPERLGTPPEYKLWIVSDRFTGYTITVRWFYGPDC